MQHAIQDGTDSTYTWRAQLSIAVGMTLGCLICKGLDYTAARFAPHAVALVLRPLVWFHFVSFVLFIAVMTYKDAKKGGRHEIPYAGVAREDAEHKPRFA